MNNIFSYSTPETIGISSAWLINFLERLEKLELPIHSAIIMRHDKICMETYYTPYTADTLHRMFSITKSFVSIAIGLLCEEGKISLDDHIVDYFPEKQPEAGPFEYTSMLTIKDMLQMKTCHDKTTYKAAGVTDWVGSFFTTKPTHIPGTNFSYDTSSTHVLGALVEKLSGMSLLDYLRVKCLDEMDFSKDSYVLKDPNGISMGGSGLCATPMDIFKVIYLIAHNGNWFGKQLLPENYIKEAVKRLADSSVKQGTIEEMQGYGYQIWKTRNDGVALFGMGGQLALYVPSKDIFMVVTADAQGRQGGVQLIYDSFWEEVYNKINSDSLPEDKNMQDTFTSFVNSRKLVSISGENSSPLFNFINNAVYTCDDNPCKISRFSLHFDNDKTGGTFNYTNATGDHSISFKIADNSVGIFPDYNLKYAASGAFKLDSTFVIRINIIDYAIGNITISLNYKDNYATACFKKVEETMLSEYNGVFSAKRQA